VAAASVEIVQRWNKLTISWASGEIGRDELEEQMAELFEPAFEYVPVQKFPDSTPCHGIAEFVDWVTRYDQAWIWHFEVEKVFSFGAERAAVRGTIHAEGRTSGLAQSGRMYEAYWFRGGLICRFEQHLTEKGTIAALGLTGELLETAG
jgi:hypothetical protein